MQMLLTTQKTIINTVKAGQGTCHIVMELFNFEMQFMLDEFMEHK